MSSEVESEPPEMDKGGSVDESSSISPDLSLRAPSARSNKTYIIVLKVDLLLD